MVVRRCKNVLVTGGIGSGKSAVCQYLEEQGVPVYDCDSHAKALYCSDPTLVNCLEEALKISLRDSDGRFDKNRLAAAIFSDRKALAIVDSIVHPAVLADFQRWKETYEADSPFVVMESAIALDNPLFDGLFDAVAVVTAPESIRIERACLRDGASREKIIARIRSQKSRTDSADVIINNDLDPETLRHRTDLAFRIIKSSILGIQA